MVATVTLRVYGDLHVFTEGDRNRGQEVQVRVGAPRSVKDVVESAGVPHPEIALLLVDGASVGFGHLLRGGERVAVYPSFHRIDIAPASLVQPPAPAPRFVCDVHLGRLARRLRLLGFDTWYRSEADDAELADVAVTDQRILLTRDRGLLMRRVIVHGYCPRSDHADVQAGEVLRRFDLAGQVAPLGRCARCNGVLRPVDKQAVIDVLPPRTRVEHERFARCADCGRVYWPGSHTTRIMRFVDHALRAAHDRRSTGLDA